jgi:uncharacterized protein YgiM (DUF1202 family)
MNAKAGPNLIWLPVAVALSLMLSACPSSPGQVQQPTAQPTLPPPTSAPPIQAPSPTTAPPTATVAPSATPTTPPTATPVPPSPTSTEPPPTETPLPTAPPSATPAPLPDAIVKADTVNLRASPDTGAKKVAALAGGDALTVTGQTNACAWLKVKTAKGQEGWVARVTGSTELVTLNKPCDSVPLIKVPTPTARPTAKPTTPTPPPASEAPELDPNLGCYLIRNYIGTELTFTITARDWNWRDSFKVPNMREQVYCLGAGRYTYTIDGQPPWSSINGELEVKPGDRLLWNISGR